MNDPTQAQYGSSIPHHPAGLPVTGEQLIDLMSVALVVLVLGLMMWRLSRA